MRADPGLFQVSGVSAAGDVLRLYELAEGDALWNGTIPDA